jgi:hypothetical protein
MSEVKYELGLNGDYLNVITTTVVKMNEEFIIYTPDGSLTLKVDIQADLAQVPSKYHEVFINVLMSKYLNKVSFSDNPFSQCHETRKKKWWEFWKIHIKI